MSRLKRHGYCNVYWTSHSVLDNHNDTVLYHKGYYNNDVKEGYFEFFVYNRPFDVYQKIYYIV